MITYIDAFLNKTTMYRLLLYVCGGLLGVALVASAFGALPFSPLALIVSTLFMMVVCSFFNDIFARVFKAAVNFESAHITALILALIITPPMAYNDMTFFAMAFWASAFAMGGKYIFAINNKHVFNPAALGVVVTSLFLGLSASWWVGTALLLPFAFFGGVLIVRKIRRTDLVLAFFAAATIAIFGPQFFMHGFVPLGRIWNTFAYSATFFFAFVMLTEPLTTPPTRMLRIAYGAIVGALLFPNLHIGSIYTTPEIALVVGNIFSYAVSPKYKLVLVLKEAKKVANDVYDFVFATSTPVAFSPGQYFEWTIPDKDPDNRGNRRYFTISSSPTENTVNMGIKFYPKPSTFKTALAAMKVGDTLVASQLAGDFTLPKDPAEKLVFIAGGIGVTPFRSMIKYLVDKGEKRDIVIFYCARTADDCAYADLFAEAGHSLGIKTYYVLSEPTAQVPYGWEGMVGALTGEVIAREAGDAAKRTYYISGPHGMIVGFTGTLRGMGVSGSHIHSDFFPGFT